MLRLHSAVVSRFSLLALLGHSSGKPKVVKIWLLKCSRACAHARRTHTHTRVKQCETQQKKKQKQKQRRCRRHIHTLHTLTKKYKIITENRRRARALARIQTQSGTRFFGSSRRGHITINTNSSTQTHNLPQPA